MYIINNFSFHSKKVAKNVAANIIAWQEMLLQMVQVKTASVHHSAMSITLHSKAAQSVHLLEILKCHSIEDLLAEHSRQQMSVNT